MIEGRPTKYPSLRTVTLVTRCYLYDVTLMWPDASD